MRQNIRWKADDLSASQRIPWILGNSEIHYSAHKIPGRKSAISPQSWVALLDSATKQRLVKTEYLVFAVMIFRLFRLVKVL